MHIAKRPPVDSPFDPRTHYSVPTNGIVRLGIGGYIHFPEPDRHAKYQDLGAKEAVVLETTNARDAGYLTVKHMSGNRDLYEFCFRVAGDEAILQTMTQCETGKNCEAWWIPSEVFDAVEQHYPDLTLRKSADDDDSGA